MIRTALVAAGSLLLAACGSTPVNPPSPLPDYKDRITTETQWKTRIGRGTEGDHLRLAPAVGDGAIFATSRDGVVRAVEADSGLTRWERDLDARLTGGTGYGNGRVVVATGDGEVRALDAETGERLWRGQVSAAVLSAPAVTESVIAVHSSDGKLFGLNADDGNQRWVYDRTVPSLTLRGTSAPRIADGYFVDGFGSGRIAAIDGRSGAVEWEAAVATPSGRSELERMVDVDAPPVVANGTVYAAAYQGRTIAVDLDTGDTRWSREIPGHAGVAVAGGTVYVVDSEDRLWALDARGGETLWRRDDLAYRSLSAPAVKGDWLLVADYEGFLHILNRQEGHLVGRHDLHAEPPAPDEPDGLSRKPVRSVLAAPVVVDEAVYILDRAGRLQRLTLTPSGD
ncbi:Beta-barrel assembly machine subunit BamB [Thiohalospira halophila DSM 15071]|uniref:Outer membrane protein assembly factor BamB n=1 Tax=Thiohalospira halophila DSM 15071 TaxID=1123397 RepID=A0A1I1QUQ9_9GAMM|nr:outer membrane protein assembly factor BamB [Thiohalospira halophila]SFD23608.1 Beta-barrel assembly machine subunit BamB [Thiohalospira halophila DSM 15071]